MTFDSDLLSTESVRAASNIYMVVVDLCSRKDHMQNMKPKMTPRKTWKNDGF